MNVNSTKLPLSPSDSCSNSYPTNCLHLQQSLTRIAMEQPVIICDDNKYENENITPSDDSFIDIDELYQDPESDDVILAKHGYRKIKKISDCLQGKLFLGETITNSTNDKVQKVAIKKVSVRLHNDKITIQDDMDMITNENIIKEAIILKYLTVDNKFTEYIQQFIDFFHSTTHFYLITKYIDGEMNLDKFVRIAHEYIKQRRLTISSYQKVTKFLYWQIVVMIEWLHNSMNICHLDLTMDNIMIKDCIFIENKQDKSITIDPRVAVRICDFGMAEGFKPKHGKSDCYQFKQFECAKHEISEYVSLKAPNVFSGDIYDARKADVWSLGILLYQMTFGFSPYTFQNQHDVGFESIVQKQMQRLLQKNKVLQYVRPSTLDVLINCLQIDEEDRYDTDQMMIHFSLSSYYVKYKKRIKQEKLHQKHKQKKLKNNMNIFPWYKELNGLK